MHAEAGIIYYDLRRKWKRQTEGVWGEGEGGGGRGQKFWQWPHSTPPNNKSRTWGGSSGSKWESSRGDRTVVIGHQLSRLVLVELGGSHSFLRQLFLLLSSSCREGLLESTISSDTLC